MSGLMITTFTSLTEDLATDEAKAGRPTLPTTPRIHTMMQMVQVVRSGPNATLIAVGHAGGRSPNWCTTPSMWCRHCPTYPRPSHRG